MTTNNASIPDSVPTPTLDKIREVHDISQRIGYFLEWLRSDNQGHGVQFMVWREVREIDEDSECPGAAGGERCYDGKTGLRPTAGDWEPDPDSPDCAQCDGIGYVIRRRETWVPDTRSTEQLLAEYFEIDLEVAAAERQAVYEHLSAQANAATTST